ncbi:MAG: hypothetical protein ACN4GZ_15105 [Acidimicrobiales bacterium]
MATAHINHNSNWLSVPFLRRLRAFGHGDLAAVLISLLVLELVLYQTTSLGADVLWVAPLVGVAVWVRQLVSRQASTNRTISD